MAMSIDSEIVPEKRSIPHEIIMAKEVTEPEIENSKAIMNENNVSRTSVFWSKEKTPESEVYKDIRPLIQNTNELVADSIKHSPIVVKPELDIFQKLSNDPVLQSFSQKAKEINQLVTFWLSLYLMH